MDLGELEGDAVTDSDFDSDDDDSDDYPDSGPFCRHWYEPWDCELTCTACGHKCGRHYYECDEPDCDCPAWVEPP